MECALFLRRSVDEGRVLEQIAAGGREAPEEARSTGSSASLTEGHAGEFFLETFLLLRVAGAREAVCKFEETLFFLLPGIEPGLDEVGDDAAGARLPRLRQ